MLQKTLFTIRSERLFSRKHSHNLRHRWFAGLAIDDPICDDNYSTFGQNRDHLLNNGLDCVFLAWVKALTYLKLQTSSEHFSVGRTLIEAQASYKDFRSKDDDDTSGSGRYAEVDCKGRPAPATPTTR